MTKFSFARVLTVSLATLAGASTFSTTAAACGGEWMPFVEVEQIDYRPMVVRRAEKAIEAGEYQAAAGFIIRAMPHIKSLDPAKSKLVARAQRVLAVAAIRQDGALPLKLELPAHVQGTWLGASAADREANLSWSVESLQGISKQRSNDPALETEVAEGLASLGKTDEARGILERLAQKDLISSAEGWASLAQLRAVSGDQDGRSAALKRCEAMAKDATMCRDGASADAAS